MGIIESKSPLERRNTVARRSQRKSIHSIKSKTGAIMKNIKKFKGVEEDSVYIEIKATIENLERDLKSKERGLQPQIINIYKDTLKKVDECSQYLEIKLKENQAKAVNEPKPEDQTNSSNDNAAVEEVDESQFRDSLMENEAHNLEQQDKRKTVQLNLVQIEPDQVNKSDKRLSVIKMGGVAVMPGTMMDEMHHKMLDSDHHRQTEAQIAKVRKDIENVELEISQFVGGKDGKHYNRIRAQLTGYFNELHELNTNNDEALQEQVKLCVVYIKSCLSFLDEKAVDIDENHDEVFMPNYPPPDTNVEKFSPVVSRGPKTTYI